MGDTKEEERKRIMENILNEHYRKGEEEQVECIDLEDDEDEHNFEETVFVGVEPEKSKPKEVIVHKTRTIILKAPKGCKHPSNSTCQKCVPQNFPVQPMKEWSCNHKFNPTCRKCVYVKERAKRILTLKHKSNIIQSINTYDCDLCDYTFGNKNNLKEHLKEHMDTQVDKEEEYQFYFKSLKGALCQLLSCREAVDQRLYYKTEVVYRIKPGTLPTKYREEFFPSQTCHFFYPLSILEFRPEMENWTDVDVPLKALSESLFYANFPNFQNRVFWAADVRDAMGHVKNEEMFIITKSRFYLIQNFKGKYQNATFCQYFTENCDEEKDRDKETNRIPEDLQEKIVTKYLHAPPVQLEDFKCPIEDCNFISDNHFVGLRNHMTIQHFSEQIEKGAKPKLHDDHYQEEVSSCMSNWNCSIHQLRAAGDLVHHYGINHCLVDKCFQEYGNFWILKNLGSRYLFETVCPYDGVKFEEESFLMDHLSLDHYYSLIRPELENRIFFKKIKRDGCSIMDFKCPFCNRKFESEGWTDDNDTIELKEMVAHCGADHGFTLYHMIADKSILENRVKQEVEIENIEKEVEAYFVMDKAESSKVKNVYKRKKTDTVKDLSETNKKARQSHSIFGSLDKEEEKGEEIQIKKENLEEDDDELRIVSIKTENE